MSQKIRYIKYIVLTSLVLFLSASCSFRPDQLWMKTNEDVWLWVSSSDTTKSFLWKGNVIDSVPNGSGVLSVIDADGHKTDHKINIFYAICISLMLFEKPGHHSKLSTYCQCNHKLQS